MIKKFEQLNIVRRFNSIPNLYFLFFGDKSSKMTYDFKEKHILKNDDELLH